MRIAAVSLTGLLLATLSVGAISRPASAPPAKGPKPAPTASPAGKPKDPDGDGNAGTKTSGKVAGSVVDRDGNPLAQAQVLCGAKSAWTRPDGTFEVEGPASGTITVKKDGKSQDFGFSITKKGLQPDPLVFTKE
jgi:hypothetical protein